MTLIPDVPVAVLVVHMLALSGLIVHTATALYKRRALIRQSREDPQLELSPALNLQASKIQAPKLPAPKPQALKPQVTRVRNSGSHYPGQPLEVH